MYTFLVLGIVPGTNIQISFELWMQLVIEFAACTLLCWTALKIYDFYRQTNQMVRLERYRLHANHLHQRAR